MNISLRLLALSLVVVAGCSKHEESLANRAGSKVGETLTDFASGVGKGVDKQMMVKIELSAALTEQGLSYTTAKSVGVDRPGTKGITVYLIASKPLKGKLVARAVNKDEQEIGRSVADVDLAEDDAKYVTFAFDREMDTQLVERYAIDVKK